MTSGEIVGNFYKEFFTDNPIKLIDIGSSGGLNPNWQEFEKYIEIVGFEPDTQAFQQLMNENHKKKKYYNIGVHSEKTEINFYLCKDRQKSSLFQPNKDFLIQFPKWKRFEVEGAEKIKVDALDNILKNNYSDPDFMKIDTEGNELSILEGGINTLTSSVFGLEVEVGFAEMRKNQPFFSDIDNFLRKNDFQLFDIRRTYWKRAIGEKFGNDKGQLALGDALYFKKIEPFYKNLTKIQYKTIIKSKVVKAISICIIYGYHDYALQMAEYTSALFNPSEVEFLKVQIQSTIRNGRKIPDFRGRGRIAQICYTLGKFIEHPSWAAGDQDLGNR
jgi:FkbM family methyltransferase